MSDQQTEFFEPGEGAEATEEAATGGAPVGTEGHEAGLWKDAWRQLRRNPLFVASSVTIVVFALMAAFPRLFLWFYPGNSDPRSCSLSNSVGRPSSTASSASTCRAATTTRR